MRTKERRLKAGRRPPSLRFNEAEHDLLFARELARATYEISDIRYNLACVYALTHRPEEMFRELQHLVADPAWRLVIQTKRAYFENYWQDSKFRRLVFLEAATSA